MRNQWTSINRQGKFEFIRFLLIKNIFSVRNDQKHHQMMTLKWKAWEAHHQLQLKLLKMKGKNFGLKIRFPFDSYIYFKPGATS